MTIVEVEAAKVAEGPAATAEEKNDEAEVNECAQSMLVW